MNEKDYRRQEELLTGWVKTHLDMPMGIARMAAGELLTILFGGNSQAVKLEEPTTQQRTQEMDITELSNLVSQLGEVLGEVGILMDSLMKFRGNLLPVYKNKLDGLLGQSAQENLDFDNHELHIKENLEFKRKVRDNPQA